MPPSKRPVFSYQTIFLKKNYLYGSHTLSSPTTDTVFLIGNIFHVFTNQKTYNYCRFLSTDRSGSYHERTAFWALRRSARCSRCMFHLCSTLWTHTHTFWACTCRFSPSTSPTITGRSFSVFSWHVYSFSYRHMSVTIFSILRFGHKSIMTQKGYLYDSLKCDQTLPVPRWNGKNLEGVMPRFH